jgi:HlyD family secretion protein
MAGGIVSGGLHVPGLPAVIASSVTIINATRCFILWEGDDVVQIPTSALFRHRDRWGVFVADQGRARLRLVEVVRRSGLWTQITMGLETGEIVVTHPGDRVHDPGRIAAEIRPYA